MTDRIVNNSGLLPSKQNNSKKTKGVEETRCNDSIVERSKFQRGPGFFMAYIIEL